MLFVKRWPIASAPRKIPPARVRVLQPTGFVFSLLFCTLIDDVVAGVQPCDWSYPGMIVTSERAYLLIIDLDTAERSRRCKRGRIGRFNTNLSYVEKIMPKCQRNFRIR